MWRSLNGGFKFAAAFAKWFLPGRSKKRGTKNFPHRQEIYSILFCPGLVPGVDLIKI